MNRTLNEGYLQLLAPMEQEMFRLLRKLVLQPSYSRDKGDVDAVGGLLAKELSCLPVDLETIEEHEVGNHLMFRTPACKRHDRSILLVGHMDTVFPRESGFNWYREDQVNVYGPGVIDMKGGLVAAVFALKALHKLELLEDIPITLVCNSDEEIGSPTSASLLTDLAYRGILGLVFECGGLNGEVVTGRKGKTGYTLDVNGQAGHAAFAGAKKASAILEMAYKIIALEKLNDTGKQLVVNVGTVFGGIGPNTIAESCSVQIDTRYLSNDDGKQCSASITEIADNCHIPGTSGKLTRVSGRYPMEQSPANLELFEKIKVIATALGMQIGHQLRSGVSDANTLASAGLPVLDGLGPVGSCDHSDREFMVRGSLLPRTALAAGLIVAGWNAFTSS